MNDHYDSEMASANSQLVASLSNIINDFYAKDISRKVYSAMKAKMENGEYIGSWEKYGYLKDPEDKNRLIVNPENSTDCAADLWGGAAKEYPIWVSISG